MITDASEYQFVTGDLDRILIDGDVMPLRTGTTSTGQPRANILRGEDPAFLWEALIEREHLSYGSGDYPVGHVFSRKVDSDPLIQWCNRLRLRVDDYARYLSAAPVEHLSVTSDPRSILTADELESSPDDFSTGRALTKEPIMKMFNDLKKTTMINTSRIGRTSDGIVFVNHVDLNPDYPYDDVHSSSDIEYNAHYGDDDTESQHKNGGSSIGYIASRYTYDLLVPAASVSLWRSVFVYERIYRDNYPTIWNDYYDFVKVGDATSSDGGYNWTLNLTYNDLYSLWSRLVAAHVSRGEMIHGIGYQPTSEHERYELGMGIYASGTHWTHLVTLGDHTKWW